MKHTYIYKVYITLALLFFANISYGQDNMIFLARNTPQTFLTNPALIPDNARFFISAPVIGGLNVNYSGNLAYSDIFKLSSSNKAIIDVKHLLSNVAENNTIRNILNIDILNLGFRISRNGFMGISLRGRTSVDVSFSKDILSFIMDNPIERTGLFNIKLTPDAISWGEFGISYSHVISKNFTVGARIKGIVGAASAQAQSATILADKKLESYTLQGDINLLAGNLNLSKDGKDVFDIKNISPGFGIDLGMNFISNNKKIRAYASISDFGRIYWNKKSSSKIISENPQAKYEWVGVKDLESLVNKSKNFKDVLDDTMNELTSAMGVDTIKAAFITNLPFTVQAGAKYSFDDKLTHTVSLNTMVMVPQFAKVYYEFTAGYTYSTRNKRWDFMTSYTYKSVNPFNIGLGALYRGRGFEMFMMSDSINSFFDIEKARSANFRLGINFYAPLRWTKSKDINMVW